MRNLGLKPRVVRWRYIVASLLFFQLAIIAVPSTATEQVQIADIREDEFEPNDSCDMGGDILVDGMPQIHSFHDSGDEDWMNIDVVAGETYVIDITALDDSIDIVAELYHYDEDCPTPSTPFHTHQRRREESFSDYVILTFTSTTDGMYALRIYNNDASIFGEHISYRVTVTQVQDEGNVLGEDEFEPNDSCEASGDISVDGMPQTHSLHTSEDVDWLQIDAVAGETYSVEITEIDNSVNIVAELWANCRTRPFQTRQKHHDLSRSTDLKLTLSPSIDGIYFLRIYNADASTFDENGTYRVTATQVPDEPIGAVVIVASRDELDDPLQSNIYNVTNRTYEMFREAGYPHSHIHYVAPEFNLNDDPNVIVDAEATVANLQDIIVNQVADQIGTEKPLTIYMMGQGFGVGFYLDEVNGQRVSIEALDSWLDTLQMNNPDVEVNIIIDACYAGAFIHGDDHTISGENRTVITSTANDQFAWSSFESSNFSDFFLIGLNQRRSLYDAFLVAQAAVSTGGVHQTAWLDDNGNGIPNDSSDGDVASRQYLIPFTSTDNTSPPLSVSLSQSAIKSTYPITLSLTFSILLILCGVTAQPIFEQYVQKRP